MLDGLIRKTRQLAGDPVLRQWLIGRAMGRLPREPEFTAHRPPYLDGLAPLHRETPSASFAGLDTGRPSAPVELSLAGQTVTVEPGGEEALFDRSFDDNETLLALHRFAWLPVMADKVDPAWVQAMWDAWRDRYREPAGRSSGGWEWHPYTAAERAINILDFAARHGLPGPLDETLNVLALHGPAIAQRLEYFGDHHTSNHLSNNGRGLFRLGLALGLEKCAALGAKILLEEAPRIFSPSGMLREGSSHYHFLLTRNYVDAWLAARAHQRPEEKRLRTIGERALAAGRGLVLPGGMPLIGDISPDCRPEFLSGLYAGGNMEDGWTGQLNHEDRQAMEKLRNSASPSASRGRPAEGWLRADFAPWSGLWHAAPKGWSHMPGHGHQDLGGFEVHYGDEPLFIDPGRGAYGEDGEAAYYRSAMAHNTLMVDGADPYPPNRPYYDDSFRHRIGAEGPELISEGNEVSLTHSGFARLSGVGAVRRCWRFSPSGLDIFDHVEGAGRRRVTRRLHTALAVEVTDKGAIIKGLQNSYRLISGTTPTATPATRWLAYGEGVGATALDFSVAANLPWKSTIKVEVI